MRNEKITPLYERLSRDDELQGESNSICSKTRYSRCKDSGPGAFHSRPAVLVSVRYSKTLPVS